MHSIVLRLKSLFTIPFSLTIVLAIIEILRIFAFNRAFFWLMQNKKNIELRSFLNRYLLKIYSYKLLIFSV